MGIEDVHDFEGRFRRERALLRETEGIADVDRRAIKRFLRRRDGATSTLKEYCARLRRMAEFAETPLAELDLEGANDLVYRVEHDYNGGVSQSTANGYALVIRLLMQDLDRDWAMQMRVPKDEPPEISPDDMLDQDDIRDLVAAADLLRDVALIEFLADTGARVGLVSSLRIRDFDLEGDIATFTPNAEAGGRKDAPVKPYPIIDSRATLRNYLRATHPEPYDRDYPFFATITDRKHDYMKPDRIRARLQKIADDAGIEKPTNPHNFRHSAISRMWREGYSKQQIQHRVAWALDTDMWSRYVHLHAEDMNRSIAVDAGEVEPEDRDGTERKRCGNCHSTVPPHRKDCPNCGSVTDPEVRTSIEGLLEALDEELVRADSAETRERLLDTRRTIEKHGAQVDTDRLHSLVSSLND